MSRYLPALLVVLALLCAGTLFLLDPRTFSFPDPTFLRSLLVGGVLLGLYTTATWGANGRTYGNVVMGIRVVSAGGGKT